MEPRSKGLAETPGQEEMLPFDSAASNPQQRVSGAERKAAMAARAAADTLMSARSAPVMMPEEICDYAVLFDQKA
jgi:hypothetical protein